MATSEATSIETNARPWGFLLIQGIAMVIIGAILLWAPAKTKLDTYSVLVALLGIYWIISGILDLVHMFTDHSAWGWKLIMGIISILAGIWVVTYPIAAGVSLPKIFVLVLGIWGLMYGIILLVMAFKGGGWGVGILGALGIFLGIFLIANWAAPGMGLAMVWAAALWLFFGGFVVIYQAFRQRKA